MTNFVLCECYGKAGHHCKNWDGKGDANQVTNEVKAICKTNETDPDTCEFLCTPIPTKGLEWIKRSKVNA